MPITAPIATLIGSAIGGGATAYGIKSSNSANKNAAALESKYNDEALKDARAERARQQAIDDDDRRLSLEDRALSNARYSDMLGYQRGRDSIEDARFNDERDYGRGEFASYKSKLAPFSNAGTRSMANLSSVVGRNLPAAIPTTGAGVMVRLQSPNGQMREVPTEHAAHYLKLGAKQV